MPLSSLKWVLVLIFVTAYFIQYLHKARVIISQALWKRIYRDVIS